MLNIQKRFVGKLTTIPAALRHSLVLAASLVFIFSAEAESSARKMFQVVTKREGNATRFYVDNREANEVTATFEVQAINLKGSKGFPYTGTFPANQLTEAFTVSPIDPEQHWNYSYTSHYTVGSSNARHDDSYVYRLPFAPGATFKCTQAHNGAYSHHGSDQYAIDFKMPVGTPVHAARGGVVAKIKDDSSKGGPDRKYENHANYVLIRHSDGTLGNYAHLAKGGAKVVVGQRVEAGDLIALSGNTGFSSGAHLHFSVFKTKNGKGRLSIPVKFETANDSAITLAEGKTYRSSPVRPGAILAVTTPAADSTSEKFQGGQTAGGQVSK